MSGASQPDVTSLLIDWNRGDRRALEQLVPLVHGELRRLAGAYFDREPVGHTLQPTALVNELYLRLIDLRRARWQDRAHFFGFAATTMRHILVDHARALRTTKRGKDLRRIALEDAAGIADETAGGDVDLIALDQALRGLAELDARQSRIVELRAFTGLSLKETAEVLGISEATVGRDWVSARAWLFRELKSE